MSGKLSPIAAAYAAAEEEARNAGFQYYLEHSDVDLIEVHREASRRYANKHCAFAFVEAFQARRRQADDYRRAKLKPGTDF